MEKKKKIKKNKKHGRELNSRCQFKHPKTGKCLSSVDFGSNGCPKSHPKKVGKNKCQDKNCMKLSHDCQIVGKGTVQFTMEFINAPSVSIVNCDRCKKSRDPHWDPQIKHHHG